MHLDLSPFRRLLMTKRRAKRIAENERLRLALDSECPIYSWRFGYPYNRRSCREGERHLVETLDAALREMPSYASENDPRPVGMFPC